MQDLRSQLAPLIVAAGGQSAVASAAGLTQAQISRYLAGKKDINAETLVRLARAVGHEVRLTRARPSPPKGH